jgi:leucine-rich PPR motif-containing protein
MNKDYYYYNYAFFLFQPIEKILYYCEELEKNFLNPRSYLIALEASLTVTKIPDQALALMEAMMKNGKPLRPHYFWPLLSSLGQKGDINGIYILNVYQFARGI